jgi:hypothetical protein
MKQKTPLFPHPLFSSFVLYFFLEVIFISGIHRIPMLPDFTFPPPFSIIYFNIVFFLFLKMQNQFNQSHTEELCFLLSHYQSIIANILSPPLPILSSFLFFLVLFFLFLIELLRCTPNATRAAQKSFISHCLVHQS